MAVETISGPHVESDAIVISGVRFLMAELFDQRFFEPAQPFPHLVREGVFNPRLLELVIKEFELPGIDRAEIKSR